MQQAGQFIVRQIAMPVKQRSVLFPQDIYSLYHAVARVEKVRKHSIMASYVFFSIVITSISLSFLILRFLQMYLQSKFSKSAFPLLRTCGFDMDAFVAWLLESDRKISIQYIFSIQSGRF